MAPNGPGTVCAAGGTSQIARIPSSSRSSSRTSRCSAWSRTGAPAPCGRRRGRRRARATTPTGVPQPRGRARPPTWASGTARRSCGPRAWRRRPSCSGVISASAGAWSSNAPSDELVRPRVSTYGRTSACVRAHARVGTPSARSHRARRRGVLGSSADGHRIADLGSDGLQLGDEPGRERARALLDEDGHLVADEADVAGPCRRSPRAPTCRTRASRRAWRLSISTMTSCTRPPPIGVEPPLAMLSSPADTAARRSPELRSRPSDSAMSRPSDDTTVASAHRAPARRSSRPAS